MGVTRHYDVTILHGELAVTTTDPQLPPVGEHQLEDGFESREVFTLLTCVQE